MIKSVVFLALAFILFDLLDAFLPVVQSAAPSTPRQLSASVDGVPQLLAELDQTLERWILSGNRVKKDKIIELLHRIEEEAEETDIDRALHMIRGAGLSVEAKKDRDKAESASSMEAQRRWDAEQRQRWEEQRAKQAGEAMAGKVARSALGQREQSGKPDPFLGQVDSPLDPMSVSKDKRALEKDLSESATSVLPPNEPIDEVSVKVSAMIAQAGAGNAFDGTTMGIGGLDDVLAEVKRRVWTPLAAPPQLLCELGIQPVRGLLLYGRPGCGKTLLARKLGQILSPLRPYTLVSGPEVLDKFVGSSEKNLRSLFDSPPDIFDSYRIGESDGGKAVEKAALHVIIMDEFDAIARSRGGRGGTGDQGDAGVARDSVVNQLLAKMDGVDPLPVPTMVIGLTNKRSLIDPALLRPGRFEVQIEVPPPRTQEQRISILKVHTRSMQQAGRLLVRDAPVGTCAARQVDLDTDVVDFASFLENLARQCEGFSGAALAGVARAAASHALERSVEEFSHNPAATDLIEQCVVTDEDFRAAVEDLQTTMDNADWSEEEDSNEASEDCNEDGGASADGHTSPQDKETRTSK